ncbi:hypothetical protein LOTGIDRAFT_157401 [Lottia gigantea]|uniref:Uncharacterized protein n=1 Tax=Lottia gigantea TaxID=225164 RepID=V4B5F3_LOTGI|nr:hypothetical protein LOTGIDRAFT_157401 [Lottia gigantea]ESP01232.1 hypothetical protein LOTGIDRAFT_157401 [Lottia gigantea]
MAGGFENVFKALCRAPANSSESDEGSTKHITSSIVKPTVESIPKLKLKVHPDFTADKGYSPFSLKHYIKSPPTDVKVISYDRGNHKTSSAINHVKHSPSQTRQYLRSDKSKDAAKNHVKKKPPPKKILLKMIQKDGKTTDNSKVKCTYQKQIVLKKYGLLFPGRKNKNNLKHTKTSPPNITNNISGLSPLLTEDRLNSSVPKTECDSHYFCQQGEGLSRNSPEAAKSVISSPANASVGENSITDPCISPLYDPGIDNLVTHEHNDQVKQTSVKTNTATHLQQNINTGKNSKKQSTLVGNEKYIRQCYTSSQHPASSKDLQNASDMPCQSNDKNNKCSKTKRKPRNSVNLNKKKRRYSGYNSDPDFEVDNTEAHSVIEEPVVDRRKRSRLKHNNSCQCCINKSVQFSRTQTLRCNTSIYEHLSKPNQNFIYHSIQQSNVKSKLYLFFCSVFPKLVPILHSMTPESQGFYLFINEMLECLQSAEKEQLTVNTVDVINLLQEMDIQNECQTIPVFQPDVILCQNPERCFSIFRDKVVKLLQLLLPSLVVSLDGYLSTTKDLELFLDKLLSSNC